MKIPKKITIAGIEYEISEVESRHPDLDYGRLSGSCFAREGWIKLNKELPTQIKEQTLLHELQHLIQDALLISNESVIIDEHFTESVTQLWYQVIKQL